MCNESEELEMNEAYIPSPLKFFPQNILRVLYLNNAISQWMFTRVSVLFLEYLVETNWQVVEILRGTWGMALYLRRTGYVTEHWNTQIEDVV